MSDYGIKLKDISGNSATLRPSALTIISAGRVTLPTELNGDNTYGTDINLPANNIPIANLAVIVTPVSCVNNVVYSRYIDDGALYYNTFYVDSAETYYTRNDATGVMTSWSAGNLTTNSKNTWNPALSIYPIAFWDKMGQSTFNEIRLFAATAYLLRETHNDVNFSLSGSASGSGSGNEGGGSVSDVKDDNESSAYWKGAYGGIETGADFSYSIEIDLGTAKNLTKVAILQRLYAQAWDGWAIGQMYVKIYSQDTSSWLTIIAKDWSWDINQVELRWHSGYWRNITKIKIEANGTSEGGSEATAHSRHYTYELRAWGSEYDDDDENKIVYSIGSDGVSAVDYLIALKNYNY